MRSLFNKSIVLAVVSGLLFLAAAQSHGGDLYVNNAEEYRISMLAHRARLVSLSSYFQDSLFTEFMKLHDEAKVNRDAKFLLKHQLPHPPAPSIAERLKEFYGKDLYAALPDDPTERKKIEDMRQRLRVVIEDVNRVDNEVGWDFFRSHPGFIEIVDGQEKLTRRALEFQYWEHTLDVVDTRIDLVRRQELRIPPERTVKDYFSRMSTEQQKLADRIVETYKAKTAGLGFFNFLWPKRCFPGALAHQLTVP